MVTITLGSTARVSKLAGQTDRMALAKCRPTRTRWGWGREAYTDGDTTIHTMEGPKL